MLRTSSHQLLLTYPPVNVPYISNMKLIVVVALCVVGALSAPAPAAEEAAHIIQILKSEFDQQPEGSYTYSFETENGISRQETGELKPVKDEEGKEQSVVVVRGSYSYPGADGKSITVNYVADESGFHADIPKAERRRR